MAIVRTKANFISAMEFYTFLCLFFVLLLPAESRRCIDLDDRCPRWKNDGECMKTTVKKSCPRSCEICDPHDRETILSDLRESANQGMMTLLVFVFLIIGGMFVAWIKINSSGGCCRSKGSMKGKVVVITGATSGIGADTAFHLAARGARVIMGCRKLKKGLKVAKDLRMQTGKKFVEVKKLDLASLDSVQEFAQEVIEEVEKVDVLINNAACISGKKRVVTSDNFEQTFQVNYLSHFLLTKLLIKKLKKNSPPSRIINIVGESYRKGDIKFSDLQGEKKFSNIQAYNNSKLALMMFTHQLSTMFKGTEVTVNAVDPGKCDTDLWNNIFPYNIKLAWLFIQPFTYLFWKSTSMAAETTYYCSLDHELETITGKYFADCKEVKFPAVDEKITQKLWEVSERLIVPKKISTPMQVISNVKTENESQSAENEPQSAENEQTSTKHEHED